MAELTASEITKQHIQWAQQQPEIGRCAFCPGYRVEGTAEEVARLNAEHTLEFHPQQKKRRSRRGQPVQALVLRQNLDDQDIEEIEIERRRRARLHGVELSD